MQSDGRVRLRKNDISVDASRKPHEVGGFHIVNREPRRVLRPALGEG
jgi:hypothetical protein